MADRASRRTDRCRRRSSGRPFAGWRVLLQIAPLSPRPHVVLFIGHEEVAGVDGLALAHAPVDQTIDSRRYGGRQRRVPAKGTRAAEPTAAYGANLPAVPAAPAA